MRRNPRSNNSRCFLLTSLLLLCSINLFCNWIVVIAFTTTISTTISTFSINNRRTSHLLSSSSNNAEVEALLAAAAKAREEANRLSVVRSKKKNIFLVRFSELYSKVQLTHNLALYFSFLSPFFLIPFQLKKGTW
jgi:hypothetical protein